MMKLFHLCKWCNLFKRHNKQNLNHKYNLLIPYLIFKLALPGYHNSSWSLDIDKYFTEIKNFVAKAILVFKFCKFFYFIKEDYAGSNI